MKPSSYDGVVGAGIALVFVVAAIGCAETDRAPDDSKRERATDESRLESTGGCTELAAAYETGEGVSQSFSTAEKLYRLACDWGKLDACSVYRMMEGTAHRFE